MNRPLYNDYSAIEADLPALLEVARLALADHRFATEVLEEELDMDLWETQQRLESFMDAEAPAGSTGSPLARALAAVPGYTLMDEPDDVYEEKPTLLEFYANRAGVAAWYHALHNDESSDGCNLASKQAEAACREG